MDNPSFQRGMVLFEQGRTRDAADRFREALSSAPQDPRSHAMLSLCLSRDEDFTAATAEAELAVSHDPELPLGFYALAFAMMSRNRDDQAREAIERAISLDRTEPNFHALLGQLYLRKSLWRMALHAADDGLAFDPQHSACLSIRSTALVQLGEREAAAVTMHEALANDPEDTWLHANQGWALLHRGQPKEAMKHFREALRLDPTNEFAKAGVVEALKASFFLYRWLLRYFLWMSRFSPRVQNGIMIVGFFAYRMLSGYAASHPEVRPFVTPLLIAYSIFALMTWLAAAFFNLLLRLHPYGRYALSPEQKRTSEIVGGLLLLTVIFVVCALTLEPTDRWVTLALTSFITALPASVILRCANGWPRYTMIAITLTLVALGIHASIDLTAAPLNRFIIAALVSQFAGMALVQVRLKR